MALPIAEHSSRISSRDVARVTSGEPSPTHVGFAAPHTLGRPKSLVVPFQVDYQQPGLSDALSLSFAHDEAVRPE